MSVTADRPTVSRVSIRARFRAEPGDEGMSLIEVIVSLVVLALFAASVSVVLMNAFGTSRSNALRVEASNLAARQLEITRNMSVLDVPDGLVYGTSSGGYSTNPATVTADDTPFTVFQDAEYVPANSSQSSCTVPAGTRLAYKRVSVYVTWPKMGATVPPRLDTLMQLPVTGLDNTKGVLSVPVHNASGQALSGVTVTVTEGGTFVGSAVTGGDGCAVISGLAPASDYMVQASLTGYVDATGTPSPSHNAPTITAATLSIDTGFVMDLGGAVQVTLAPPSVSYVLPTTPLDVTLVNNSASPQYLKTFPDCSVGPAGYCSTGSGMTRNVGSPSDSNPNQHGLFPFTTQDGIFVNDYNDPNAPSVSVSVVGGATTTTTSPAGGVPLGGVKVTNSTALSTSMWAYDKTLQTDQLLQLAPTATPIGKGASAYYALPYGTWCIGATKTTAQQTTCPAGQSVTLKATARTATVTVTS